MQHLRHKNFRLNGNAFASAEELIGFAEKLQFSKQEFEIAIGKFIAEWLSEESYILVKTSGSTGIPKQIELPKKNVANSARATIGYFNLYENTTALLCLPAEFIAGKMMLVRAMLAGWDLYSVEPGREPLKNLNIHFDFAAMVPYQAFHSLSHLKKIKKMIVGGGAVPKSLEASFQKVPTRIFATYGMTETISHIAIRPINGPEKSMVYAALPKVKFSLDSRDCLQIIAPEINEQTVVTNDVVELISDTSFKFLGRIDNVINSGGIKIFPEAVEEKLSDYIIFPFFIASEKDVALGERIILVVESENEDTDYSEVFKILSAYEKPKKIYTIKNFVYTETGKVKRAETLGSILNS
ncbi:AMP-binding protein [Aequorivita echinoideorum]|uniref:AMP-binding protein n=1 Tax=Aequorivita echinoideorum TaxID=1549647 RepID=A0ABS5S5N9_9FLAO|nr:AMP-binding protein [Aequorivita echinoideorum]MBT0608540.1 AMP-binding protein [Aequorivita echinoideorum]